MACGIHRYNYMGILPIVMLALSITMLVSAYIVAVTRGDVAFLFPYISDAASTAPQSCIFGQLLNMTALIVFAGVFVRFRQLTSLVPPYYVKIKSMNIWGLVFGWTSGFGMTLVANFQDSNVLIVHLIGAFLLFVMGTAYCVTHTIISYKLYPQYNTMLLCRLRLVITTTTAVSMIISIITGVIAEMLWFHTHGDHTRTRSQVHWAPQDGGYIPHLISAFSEWVMSIALMVFYLTYTKEFCNLQLHVMVSQCDLPDALWITCREVLSPPIRTPSQRPTRSREGDDDEVLDAEMAEEGMVPRPCCHRNSQESTGSQSTITLHSEHSPLCKTHTEKGKLFV
ncbi:DNA damage-regulated autophagy modulator protein 1 [Strongylocentrotus purpuratus]|uniref:CWH43-like N-terminal domain-containing protein n=1 Tax=Strongylocentrotus purpuratus TaxID=7668 RepID=A0A7M7P3N2_STRPU|nr:DNA damage-regulated autophagy modulator protein 1 [Strongylocentrotus purpuratus]